MAKRKTPKKALAKLSAQMLFRRAAAAHKRAMVHAENAVKHMTDCIFAHLEEGKYLLAWQVRENMKERRVWLKRLKTEYCDVYNVGERSAARSVLFASVDEKEFLRNLPSMANIHDAEKFAQLQKRGKVIEHKPADKKPTPPTPPTPPQPPATMILPDYGDLEVDAEGNVVMVTSPTSAPQPPEPEGLTDEQRTIVWDYVAEALVNVGLVNHVDDAVMDKAQNFLVAFDMDEEKIYERLVLLGGR